MTCLTSCSASFSSCLSLAVVGSSCCCSCWLPLCICSCCLMTICCCSYRSCCCSNICCCWYICCWYSSASPLVIWGSVQNPLLACCWYSSVSSGPLTLICSTMALYRDGLAAARFSKFFRTSMSSSADGS